MWAFGWKLTAPDSPQQKQYTTVVMGNRVITNYGAGDANGRTKVITENNLSAVNGEKDFNETVREMAGEVTTGWHNLYSSSGEYSQVDLAPTTILIRGNDSSTPEEIMKNFVDKAAGAKEKPSITDMMKEYYHYGEKTHEQNFGAKPKASTSTPKKSDTPKSDKFVINDKFLRPNGEEYHARTIQGHQDVALLRRMREKDIYVRVYGPPGAGKNALAEAAFPDLVTVTGHGDMTVSHFAGSLLPTPQGGWQWADGPLTKAMKSGSPLMVDEVTRIPTEVLAVLYSVMDGRGELRLDDRPDVEPVKAEKGFYVIAGYNPDTLGARALDEALISRFRIGVEITTDFDTAKNLGVPNDAVRLAKNLDTRSKNDMKDGGPGNWVPQMRELLTFRDLIAAGLDTEFALAALLGACPREEDQDIVIQTASSVFGLSDITPLSLGRRL